MNISTVNISQTVTDIKSIAIANQYKVAYGLSIGIFTFDLTQFKGQVHANFDCKYRAYCKREG